MLALSLGVMGVLSCSDDDAGSAPARCVPAPAASSSTPAADATSAWPDRAPVPAPLTREEVLGACVRVYGCNQVVDPDGAPASFGVCLSALEYSLERGIPVSRYPLVLGTTRVANASESAEFFARCVLAAGASCDQVFSCATARQATPCEEIGCHTSPQLTATCAGAIATLTDSCGQTSSRDCSRADAVCDPASPTGCSDRLRSSCPEGVTRADRCDGNVRLGCDGTDHVSYHDCSRVAGGTCQQVEGRGVCVFPAGDLEPCDMPATFACVSGGMVQACVLGALVKAAVDASICPP